MLNNLTLVTLSFFPFSFLVFCSYLHKYKFTCIFISFADIRIYSLLCNFWHAFWFLLR